jgi:putative peptide zinc metalloprotease protein
MLASLPTLRQELAIAAGPRLADGQPSWTLHDPVRNLFFQLDWPSFEMLSRWDLREPQAVLAEIARDTALQLDGDALEGLLAFLREQQLLQPGNGAAAAMAAMRERQRGNWHQWLLHNYLFFRIPLLRPDRWLTWLQPRLAFLFGRTFRRLTFAAGVLGLAGVYREWDHFSATLMDTLSWNGALLYGCAIAFAKTCHEMGHALTAKRYGCRVPTMGLAFLVMWPVAYTDTNEVWKLADRGQRLAVASAGIATELCIAVWATLAWAWLPEGGPRQVAFLLSTTTWITTLAINASPFMRFDGYYMLSDFLGLPNLHGRAFALARWDLRERLFAFGEPVPEVFSRRLHAGLIVFAWAVWIYRLVLFLGIAALVYHFFIKAVGIVLFAVEMGWFVALPVWREVQAWRARGPALRRSRRARRSAVLAALVVLAFFVPWPARVNTSGLLLPQTRQALYAPPSAMLEALPVADGVMVDVDPDLRPGEWLKTQEYLGSLVAPGRWQVVTYVDEEAVRRIARGDRALFIADGLGAPALRLAVASIDRDASRTLGEPELASLFGGDVLVREKSGVLYPEHAVYRVVLDADEALSATSPSWRGHVAIAGQWEVPAMRFLRNAVSVGWREAGF